MCVMKITSLGAVRLATFYFGSKVETYGPELIVSIFFLATLDS
jgi:hypothetical protein